MLAARTGHCTVEVRLRDKLAMTVRLPTQETMSADLRQTSNH